MRSKTPKKTWNNHTLNIAILFVAASIFLFSIHFTRQKIHKASDLEIVQGKMLNYSFIDGYSGRHYYDIFLDGKTAPYKIPVDFLGCFDKSSFESTVHAGDFLKLSFNKKLRVFSISDANRNYLSVGSTIEIYNKKSDVQVALVMFLLGITILAGRYFYKSSNLLRS